uniref:Isoleucine--tRNA ligase n=1 Tax=uncultured Acidobacteria bacterium A2 TaxID=1036852 RepID=F8TTG6_9BACT|nr:isoleucyl-tRNA synthetase [uncultured Acidobacteria bacterium A2]
MPFEKVETQVDFPAQERAILEYWHKNRTFEKLLAQNKGKPRWSFLDGPITANNPMGVHHAWGRTYKDAFQRYFAMTGHEQRYQNGFDCQGLWVEVEVEKELKLQSKRDIENLVPGDKFASIDKFVLECKARVDKFARRQTDQSIRLGYWMDWDREEDWPKPPGERRSYFTMSEENNYTIWSFLKKCFERGLVYRGYDAMPWCPRCAVGLSQMEMHEGYVRVAHRAVFVRFPLREKPGENLLVWTTTPWTLSSNVGAAVNPELTYLKVKHRDQIYYLAKGAFTAQRLEEEFKRKEWVEGVPKLKTLEQIFKEKGGYEVVGQVKGADMVGWTYQGPFDELDAQAHPAGFPKETAEVVIKQGWAPKQGARDLHRVILWNAVGETEGTGIVHIAPGCGKEDFLLGREQKLPPVAPLDDEGMFLPGFGALTGKSAIDPATTDWILENLEQKGVLLAVEKYPHSYPHCWRCKTELLFRLVDEWFIDMKWRDEIMAVTEQVTFLPESINGKARELDWLKNMGDWMISKKRFWGLALPIWVCEKCNHFEVIGGRAELKERAVAGWDRFEGKPPHRPWVDLVKIKCSKCGGQSSRISDVGNPWLDAGIVPYSTMKYNTDRAYWEKCFPADFITECFPGQFRNWFYAILAMSTMMEKRPPFKVLLGHGLVRDQNGQEMHKSWGNAIPFEGAAEEGYWLAVRDLRSNEKPDEVMKKEKLPDSALELKVGSVTREGKDFPVLLARFPPMGADVMRWLYCRQNPASNINFGPGPANELRSKLVIKLWNTYSFFATNARIAVADGGFDTKAAEVPVAKRPDFDRWLLSELQTLIKKAHEGFTSFNLPTFCLEAEAFVDEKLSNWWLRRNKERVWKKQQDADKLSAYQTLYATLLTLTKLIAPVMPFLAETMYQNLAKNEQAPGSKTAPESVHLCEMPRADESLIDADLSADMEAIQTLKELGSAARNAVKLKVRQPLAEIVVQPAADSRARRAAERFTDVLLDELNIKKLSWHDPAKGELLRYDIKPNLKTLGQRVGNKLGDVQKALPKVPAAVLMACVRERKNYPLKLESGEVIDIEPGDLWVQTSGPDGWAGVEDKGTAVAVDARISEELKLEGLARDVIRQVQNLRKDANLDMEDRIVLYLGTTDEQLAKAIETHRPYIADETLTVEWSKTPLTGDGVHQADVKIEGKPLTINLRKAS